MADGNALRNPALAISHSFVDPVRKEFLVVPMLLLPILGVYRPTYRVRVQGWVELTDVEP